MPQMYILAKNPLGNMVRTLTNYYYNAIDGSIRRSIPKVKGKAARKADKKMRRK